MSKLIPLLLHIESIAFGEALLKIHAMPGVAKYEIPLGHGGEGAGRKQLEKAAATQAVSNGHGQKERTVAAMLATGPKHIREISHALGGTKSRAYGVTNALGKKGIVESLGKGMWQLTKGARAHLETVTPALPAPAQITKGPGGRATPGSGLIILRTALATGKKTTGDIRKHLGDHGMSGKSVSGILTRARIAGIIRNNGTGYELTAKGIKSAEVAAHG